MVDKIEDDPGRSTITRVGLTADQQRALKDVGLRVVSEGAVSAMGGTVEEVWKIVAQKFSWLRQPCGAAVCSQCVTLSHGEWGNSEALAVTVSCQGGLNPDLTPQAATDDALRPVGQGPACRLAHVATEAHIKASLDT